MTRRDCGTRVIYANYVIYARQRHAWMKGGDPAPVPSMTKNVIYAQGDPHRDSLAHIA
jgi:hypothetical protein